MVTVRRTRLSAGTATSATRRIMKEPCICKKHKIEGFVHLRDPQAADYSWYDSDAPSLVPERFVGI
jgi:hypothetical protein